MCCDTRLYPWSQANDAAAAQTARSAIQATPEAIVVLDASLAPYGEIGARPPWKFTPLVEECSCSQADL